MDQKASLFERSEFRSFPIFCSAQTGTRRAANAVAFFCLHFLGEARKVSSCRSTTGLQSRNNDSGEFISCAMQICSYALSQNIHLDKSAAAPPS
jgi:hypothetical protein